jgi:hypothetical protein
LSRGIYRSTWKYDKDGLKGKEDFYWSTQASSSEVGTSNKKSSSSSPTISDVKKTCSNCHHEETTSNARFCSNCGQKFDTNEIISSSSSSFKQQIRQQNITRIQEKPKQEEVEKTEQRSTDNRSIGKVAVVVPALIFLPILGVIILVYKSKNHGKRK